MSLNLPRIIAVKCPTCGQPFDISREVLNKGWNIKTCEFESGGCHIPFAIRVSVDVQVTAYSVKTPEYDHRVEIFGNVEEPMACPECGSRKICRDPNAPRGDFRYDCLSCGVFFSQDLRVQDAIDLRLIEEIQDPEKLREEEDPVVEEIHKAKNLEKLREENDPDVN